MSYLALARKWRPRTFSELVGQDHINKAIIKSLDLQRIHHAYLFTGTRGVGKTSIARLMAKALNCEVAISSKPCLVCDACTSIEKGQFIDLIEIDAASKTRVEDTKDVLENVQYAPTVGRFKIYLIDEVHMLSQHSFNALLKTLEEPPAHVIFILATTDPQKLPATVLSRCLQFHLKHLTHDVIAAQLKHILANESLVFEESAISLLARAAHGSMRDALSLLDQAIASSGDILTEQEVRSMLGYTRQDYAKQLLLSLAQFNAKSVISLSRHIAHEGGHFTYALEELLDYIHQLSVYQSLSEEPSILDFSNDIKELSAFFKPEELQLFYEIALKGHHQIHLAPSLLIGFEMTLLRMLTFRPTPKRSSPPEALIKQAARVEEDNHITPQLANQSEKPNTEVPQLVNELVNVSPTEDDADMRPDLSEDESYKDAYFQENVIEVSQPVAAPPVVLQSNHLDTGITNAHNNEIKMDNQDWTSIISKLQLTGLAQNAAENAEMVNKSDRTIYLNVAKGHQSLFTPNVVQRIEQALSNYYNEPTKLSIDYDATTKSSPAQKKQIKQHENHEEATESLNNDLFLQELQQEFSAEWVKGTVELL